MTLWYGIFIALGRNRKKDPEIEVNMSYIGNSRFAWKYAFCHKTRDRGGLVVECFLYTYKAYV